MMRFEMRALQSGPAHPSTSKKNKKTKEKHEDSSRKTGLRKWACSVHYVTNEFRSGWREGGGWGEEESNHRPSLATDGPIRGDDDLLLFFFRSRAAAAVADWNSSVRLGFLFCFSFRFTLASFSSAGSWQWLAPVVFMFSSLKKSCLVFVFLEKIRPAGGAFF